MVSQPERASSSKSAQVRRWRGGQWVGDVLDLLSAEEPLEIRVRGQSIAITMRTPGHDEELAAGFLLTESIIQHREDVLEIAHCREGEAAQLGNTLNVFLAPNVTVDFARLTRHVFASSSCGLCGKASIEAVQQHFPPVQSDLSISAQTLALLPEKLRKAQPTFEQTGGLHAAALFTRDGDAVVVREDVGRHNAVDKVTGHAFLNRIPTANTILMVSGRASFEILQKALAARIAIVAAVSAPSSLAVQLAQDSGQTLVGFLRGQSMNVYSHPGRIV
ncbi:MAG: formate dehydrogenase accessory sulfurtransferase FdhD [Pedosphaera sp.]|nr:formate dehydrogenase accessory sulfurtransferase FdhD [Pedosphaera sp.]MSU44040.1 formate dehydrogenase accessory sulfurtransferase FdhD [Pedosphaera sp.]